MYWSVQNTQKNTLLSLRPFLVTYPSFHFSASESQFFVTVSPRASGLMKWPSALICTSSFPCPAPDNLYLTYQTEIHTAHTHACWCGWWRVNNPTALTSQAWASWRMFGQCPGTLVLSDSVSVCVCAHLCVCKWWKTASRLGFKKRKIQSTNFLFCLSAFIYSPNYSYWEFWIIIHVFHNCLWLLLNMLTERMNKKGLKFKTHWQSS